MPSNLKRLAQSDPALGSVTQKEMALISDILAHAAKRIENPLTRLFAPKRHKDKLQAIQMLAATFARAPKLNGSALSLASQVKLAMSWEDENG